MSGLNMGNLGLRIISGIIMAGVALAALVLGGYFWIAIITLLGIMLAFEWSTLVRLPKSVQSGAMLAAAVVAVILIADFAGFLYSIAVISGLLIGCGIASKAASDRGILWFGIGLAYIGFPVLALIYLRILPEPVGFIVTLWLMLVIWATDIFAYFVGKSVGGPKFLPTISPKKTWAGFFGALAGATLVAIGTAQFFNLGAPLFSLIVTSIAVSVLAQAGDALESALKRSLNVKDSGSLIPGHGGFFDRLDGVLVSAPVVAFALVMRDTGLAI